MNYPAKKPVLWAGALAVLMAGGAHAEGPGIRAGELTIHPELFVQGAYDNNVFLEDTAEEPAESGDAPSA